MRTFISSVARRLADCIEFVEACNEASFETQRAHARALAAQQHENKLRLARSLGIDPSAMRASHINPHLKAAKREIEERRVERKRQIAQFRRDKQQLQDEALV